MDRACKRESETKAGARSTLAIHGGSPVRRDPLPLPLYGTLLTGEEELALLAEVIESAIHRTLPRVTPDAWLLRSRHLSRHG